MTKIAALLSNCFVLYFLLASNNIYAQANTISKTDFRTELILLKGQLENQHIGLYTYQTAEGIDSLINKLTNSLSERISMLDAFHHMAFFTSSIQDGHSILYPSEIKLKQYYEQGPIFPLDVFYNGKSLHVIDNFSSENNIPLGAEIKRINGVEVDDLFRQIVYRLPRDGSNMQYPSHLFYKFFPAYYAFFYGYVETFEVEYEDKFKQLSIVKLSALPRNKIRQKRKEQNKIASKIIELSIDKDNNIATIKIGSFDNTIIKKEYNQNFRKEIKSAFKTIKENKIQSLVIDLRDNQGGDLSNGAYLLRYLTHQRIDYLHSLNRLKINKTTKQRILKRKFTFSRLKLSPKINNYKGNIYLFTNGGSFSCSAIVANAFQKGDMGIIVGEMTGGSSAINCGGPNKVTIMPYSKVSFTIPTTLYKLNESYNHDTKGVIPDIKVQDNYKRYLGGEDLFMKAVLNIK